MAKRSQECVSRGCALRPEGLGRRAAPADRTTPIFSHSLAHSKPKSHTLGPVYLPEWDW